LAETQTATMKRPILPFLRIPEKPSEKPYLVGNKCKNCGTVYLGSRMGCSRCMSTEPMEEIRLSDRGELHVFSIVHQSAPGIPTPYIAAIIDLPEGVSVRANIEGVEPDPKNLTFGMPVEMYTEVVHVDKEGNEIIAFKYRPAGAH
jgi:uncharacterized OB-fold protein